ncbi:MAG: hypothetical protein AB7S26_22495 [Sandaracinaceae bacterium]
MLRVSLPARIALVVAIACAAFAIPSPSLAQRRPRAAVFPMGGRGSPAITRAVRSAVEEHADLVEASGDDPGDPSERAATAVELRADVLVVGHVGGTRRRQRLSLTFIDARGEERDRQSGALPRGGRAVRTIQRMVSRGFDAIGPIAAPEPEPEPAERPWYDRGEDDLEPEEHEDPSGGSSGGDEGGLLSYGDHFRPWLRAHVGIGLRNRHLDVQIGGGRDDLRHNIDFFPEFLAEAEVRPLAFLHEDLLYGIRVRARFEYALYWESADPSGNVFGGTQFGFSADAGYLVPLAGLLELGATLGGGISSYQIDANPFVPSLDYSHFELRAVGRIRAYEDLLILHADLGYRYARGAGALPEMFGDMDGNGVVFSGGASGTILVTDDIGIDYGFELEWQRVWFSFSGMPSDTLAMSGSDELVRGRLLVGMSVQ